VWVREGEKTLTERIKVACKDLGNDRELIPFFSRLFGSKFIDDWYRYVVIIPPEANQNDQEEACSFNCNTRGEIEVCLLYYDPLLCE
jgi:hypothetical protein